MRKRLGCLSPSGIGAAGLTLLGVVLIMVLGGGKLFSPGPLSERVGEIPRNGVRSHAEIGGECSACHPQLALGDSMSERCLICHVEVARELQDTASLHGTLVAQEPELACQACHTEHRGAEAHLTVVDPLRFPHQATGYSLAGHQQTPTGGLFACPDCHGDDLTYFDPGTCQDCHGNLDAAYLQAHVESFGTDCLVCHDGLDTYGTEFDHSRLAFPLLGDHALQPCQACHAGARSPSDLRAVARNCFDCHQASDAHEGQLGQNCGQCHAPESWAQATFDHDQTGFLLAGRHDGTACRGCHVDGIFAGTDRECYACHQAIDVHEGVLGVSCDRCHTPEDWAQVMVEHDLTAFPLVGRHQTVDCQGCHQDRRFRGTSTECSQCHLQDDAHQGSLGQACDQCHSPEDWKRVTVDHDLFAFQLVGRHQQVDCQDCHPDRLFQGTPVDCAGCHGEDDAHEGRLGELCDQCHTPEAWEQVTIDHDLTAFPLVGRHQGVDCQDCHADRIFRGTPVDCAGCHSEDDAHEGRLGVVCDQCHTPDGWEEATIDHDLTTFRLVGRHQQVDCVDCHPERRFRGTPADCFSCHQQADDHGGQYGTLCRQCHSPQGWEQATLDHNQIGFPLTGAHTQISCLRCHTGGVFQGTSRDCVACHGEPPFHAGLFGSDCAACHNTSGWRPATYSRPHSFPLSHGADGPSSCDTCHAGSLLSYHCFSCHDPGSVTEEHDEEGSSDIGNCVRCHPTGEED